MPLLGQKIYLAKAEENRTKKGKGKFEIPFTNEVFISKDEYDQQMQAYKQPIWTCQCTGFTGLTYEDALRSETEVHKRLSSKFPKHLERPVLQLVHHRAAPLDVIVDEALQCIQTVFGPNEVVELKVKVRGKVIRGKVVDSKEMSDDELPTSDKENSVTEDHPYSSPQSTGKQNKTTSFQYNVQVEGEDKVIHSIPGKDLLHTSTLPSRDLLQLFIRASAVQAGRLPASPWVVSDELVSKFDLPNQINEVTLSPYKVMPSSLGNLTSIKRYAEPHQMASKSRKRKLMESNFSSSGPKLKQSTLLDFGKKDNMVLSVVLQRDQNVSNGGWNQNTMVTPSKHNPNIMTSPEKVHLDHSYSSPSPHQKSEAKSSAKKEKTSPKRNEKAEKKTKKVDKKKEKKAPASKKATKTSDDKKSSKSSKSSKSKPQSKKVSKKKESKPDSDNEDVVVIDDDNEVSFKKSPRASRSKDDDVIIIDVVDSPAKSDKSSDEIGKSDKKKLPTKRKLTDHIKTVPGTSPRRASPGRSPGKVSKKETSKGKASKRPAKGKTAKPAKKSASPRRASPKGKKKESSSESSSSSSDSSSSDSSSSDSSSSESSSEEDDFEDDKKTSPKKKAAAKTKKQPAKKAAQKKQPAKKKTATGKTLSQKGTPKKGTPKKSVEKKAEEESKGTPKRGTPKKGTPSKGTPKKSPAKKATPKKSTPKKATMPKKGTTTKKTPKKATPKKAAGKKTPLKTPKSGKKPFKQATLFDVGAKKGRKKEGNAVTKVSPKKAPKSPRQPPIANKLCRIKKKEPELYKKLLLKAARELTEKQMENLKPEIKDDVLLKYKRRMLALKWKNMSPEERIKEKERIKQEKKQEKEKMSEEMKEERKKKRREEREKKNAELRIQRLEQAKRFEDQDLDLKPLPAPKLVSMPEGLPNALFGDIAMVVEFLNCYSGLLMPDDPYPITADCLMKALVYGTEGFAYLARVLVILLKTLLQDEIAEDWKELTMKLSDITVNMRTSSELLRMSLRRTDHEHTPAKEKDDEDSNYSDSSEEDDDDDVPYELVEKLESQEFFDLEPEEKLQLMVCVCHRIMGSYAIQDFMEGKQKAAAKLWREKIASLKEKNDKLREEKQKKKEQQEAERLEKEKLKEMKANGENSSDEKKVNGEASTETTDTKKPEDTKKTKPKKGRPKKVDATKSAEGSGSNTPDVEEEALDLASVVKRRRVLAAKMKAEKAIQDKLDKERREKEYEIYKKQREKELFEKSFEEGIQLAKLTLRTAPVGTDRNHSRYWIFSTVNPGLFIEKGWAGQDVGYSPGQENGEEEGEDKQIEHTIPKIGQNLWFQYSSVKEIDTLLEALNNRGIRESALYVELKKRYEDITKLTFLSRRTADLRDSDGPKELLDSFREDMSDLELNIRQGQLGGVVNFDKWEKKLLASSKLKDLGNLMIESYQKVNRKFLQGILRPSQPKPPQENDYDYNDPFIDDGPKKKPKGKFLIVEVRKDHYKSCSLKGALMIESYQNVNIKFLSGMLRPPQNWSYKKDEDNDDDVSIIDESVDADKKEEALTKQIRMWIESVKSAPTLSRLHVLLAVFETCIKWEKSAANARCKICRKKKDDNKLLLCDECNQPFHLFCLRPALTAVPKGEWKCPACAPSERRASRNHRNYYGMDGSSSEVEISEEEEEIENEKVCTVCEEDGELVPCRSCPSSYHRECHDPPLKNFPRGKWTCSNCLNPKSKKAKNARAKRAAARKQQDSDDSDEESSSSEDDSDFEEETKRKPTRGKNAPKRGRGRPRKKEESEDEEEEESSEEESESEEEEEETKRPTRGRGRPAKKRKKEESSEEEESEEEEEESEEEEIDVEYDNEVAEGIINKLMTYRGSVPFRTSPDAAEAPDYEDMIKIPMNLQMVKIKCGNNEYETYPEFFADVKLIFTNCHQYYEESNYIRKQASKLEDCFVNQIKWANPDAVAIYQSLPEVTEEADDAEDDASSAPASSTDDTESTTDQRPTRRRSSRR